MTAKDSEGSLWNLFGYRVADELRLFHGQVGEVHWPNIDYYY